MKAQADFFHSCCRVFTWTLLFVLFVASASFAQQPKATIKAFSGDVMVSLLGRSDSPVTWNTVLSQGDAIQTYAGATAVLELSDGSTVELGEHTMIYFAVLEQSPGKRARATQLHLLWGRIRTVLTPAHQKKGSSFKVETLNAMVDVTFSAPTIEVLYSPETDTTTAFAHTVPLSLTNLMAGAKMFIEEGHVGIIQGRSVEEKGEISQFLEESTSFIFSMSQSSERQPIRQLLQTFRQARRDREIFRHFHPGAVYTPHKTTQVP